VFVGRLLPTVRSLVSIPAGFSDMSLRRMLMWSTIGTAGWTTALTIAGYVLGNRYKDIDQYLGPVSTGILVAMVLWYFYRVVTWKPNR
jgi:membrane protein DedA with SNARE-associated domain